MDEDKLKELMMHAYVDTYNKGWQGAMEHFKKQLVKNILSDGLISTNVDVDHLERIVRIIEDTQ